MNWSRRLTTFVTFDPSIPTSNELPSPVNPAFCRPLLPHCSVRGRPASEGFPSTGITLQGPAQRLHTLCPVCPHRTGLTSAQQTPCSSDSEPRNWRLEEATAPALERHKTGRWIQIRLFLLTGPTSHPSKPRGVLFTFEPFSSLSRMTGTQQMLRL